MMGPCNTLSEDNQLSEPHVTHLMRVVSILWLRLPALHLSQSSRDRALEGGGRSSPGKAFALFSGI